MSIASMTAARIVRENQGAGVQRGGPALSAAATPQAPDKEGVLTQLLRYTPTEVVGLYLAAVSFVPEIPTQSGTDKSTALWDYDFRPRWGVFLFFLVGTVIAVATANKVQARKAKVSFNWPIFEMVVAPVAFSAWAFALPLAPIFSWHSWHAWIGALIAVGTLFLVGQIANWTDKPLTYDSK